jgi:hypothetical protein
VIGNAVYKKTNISGDMGHDENVGKNGAVDFFR